MSKAYRMTSHRGPLAVMICMLLLLIYFILDNFFFSPWHHANLWPAPVFAVIGLGAAGLAWYVAKAAPFRERLGVALMLGAAVGLALWPASLRLNAIGIEDRPGPVYYIPIEAGVYEPVEEGYPALRFIGNSDYWETAEGMGERVFRPARGTLGFWQLYFRFVSDDIRRYNASQAGETRD